MFFWHLLIWIIAACTVLSVVYVGYRIPCLFDIAPAWTIGQRMLAGIGIIAAFAGCFALCVNVPSAVVCVFYCAICLLIGDMLFWGLGKFCKIPHALQYLPLGFAVCALLFGWYQAHNVQKTQYLLPTDKHVLPLKIAMIADVHLGTTFNAEGFAEHLHMIEAEKPDLLVVVGDYVDDETRREDMVKASEALGKVATKYGVYFVTGNHDKGYYGDEYRGFSEKELLTTLAKNKVKVLQDETVPIGDTYLLVGRRDKSYVRKDMQKLTKDLDFNKYIIVLDHQPADFAAQAEIGVDLVLCGHTHGGQLIPFNEVGRWLGMNDRVYGYERRRHTDFIVTSGIAAWAIRFKTGTKSEFVLIDIEPENL